jgi:hypothetical protein
MSPEEKALRESYKGKSRRAQEKPRYIWLTLYKEEHRKLRQLAGRAGLSVSAYVRQLVYRNIKH